MKLPQWTAAQALEPSSNRPYLAGPGASHAGQERVVPSVIGYGTAPGGNLITADDLALNALGSKLCGGRPTMLHIKNIINSIPLNNLLQPDLDKIAAEAVDPNGFVGVRSNVHVTDDDNTPHLTVRLSSYNQTCHLHVKCDERNAPRGHMGWIVTGAICR